MSLGSKTMIKGFVCEFLSDNWVEIYFYDENKKRISKKIQISQYESIANVIFRLKTINPKEHQKGLFDEV